MTISFIRIDDRMIHGQTCIGWSKHYPCEGIVLVNDNAAKTPILKKALMNASGKKTFVWTYEEWKVKSQKVVDSKTKYFLITKDPLTMKKILVDDEFNPAGLKDVVVGPCNERPNATNIGPNQCILQEEAEAIEALNQKGYTVEFALIKEESVGTWEKYRSKFGY